MNKFILTGMPGAGKTSIIRQLECDGFSVVEEAASDMIALQQAQGIGEPWTTPSFIDAVIQLQKQRQLQASDGQSELQFHDRSAICTAALAKYLDYPASEILVRELTRVRNKRVYRNEVLFIRNLGFITPTQARQISFQEALRFERIHEETYRELGFEIISIEPGDLVSRVAAVRTAAETAILAKPFNFCSP